MLNRKIYTQFTISNSCRKYVKKWWIMKTVEHDGNGRKRANVVIAYLETKHKSPTWGQRHTYPVGELDSWHRPPLVQGFCAQVSQPVTPTLLSLVRVMSVRPSPRRLMQPTNPRAKPRSALTS